MSDISRQRPLFSSAKVPSSNPDSDDRPFQADSFFSACRRVLRRHCSLSSAKRSERRSRLSSPEALEMRSLMTASSLVAACGCSSSPGHSAAGSSTDAPGVAVRIINGTVTTQFPSVGKIGDSTGYGCSGTLIAPQFVLTAAHCAEGVSNTGGRFMIGNEEYRTSRVILHPRYNADQIGSDTANDIAIFQLDRPVTNVTPSPIYRSNPAVGQALTLVGFGYGGTGTSGSDGIYGVKRSGTTSIDRVSSTLISWDFDNNSESNTAPGDSGGAGFINVGGINYLAGVTSGGTLDNAGLGDNSFDTRVDAYAAWIDSIVGSPTPATPVVSVRASDAMAAETAAGQTANPGSFVISRTGPVTSALTVTLTVSGTATNGTDYSSIPTSVTIPVGAASVTVTLNVRDDLLAEGTETATLTVSSGAGYTVESATRVATVSVADNEAVVSNNLFANRRTLRGSQATVTGSNVNATRETGEPNIEGVSGGKSVWWTWTAAVAGRVTISTAGSSFDTTLGVYRGNAVNALTRVISNDDANATGNDFTSRVAFNAVAGQTYQIAVDGYDGESGTIRLSLDQPAGRSVPKKSGAGALARTDETGAGLSHQHISHRQSLRGSAVQAGGRSSVAVPRTAMVVSNREQFVESSLTRSATDALFECGLQQLLDRL